MRSSKLQAVSNAASMLPGTNSELNIENAVRTRAYQLYESRGREHGHDLDDWLTAESEMKKSETKRAAA